jgi:dihydropteroate synthase
MTKLVGILNITPDSFSDSGLDWQGEGAIKAAEKLISSGINVLDIGAESTRPNALQIDSATEINRLKPALTTIIKQAHSADILVSIDTRHHETAQYAISQGANWINDVGGGENLDLLKVVAEAKLNYVLMHSLTIPADPNVILANNAQLYPMIRDFFINKINSLEQIGIFRDKIIIDAGIGFGKDAYGSLNLMLNSAKLQAEISCPLLVGHSRKSMFQAVGATNMEERNQLTLLSSLFLIKQNIAYLRVHDAAAHQDLISNLF